ncbi:MULTISPECIES: Asp23/Gls24 family envelope stress response protein [unclassified Streptomyces]|uniref:Asp23/Gls24 family envelope stress response protein n=1 Tax=unclassified Streptomyces TaxID=2593676 RepID=UPI002E363EC8|nr:MULTISPECIES: Asp23/Gls24 family envelope stress response protein [unclassified Streptomyces]WUC68336.1 Asp23/Gls24 family envelope stress response protein [Streptomyces sp. NBC_00539]
MTSDPATGPSAGAADASLAGAVPPAERGATVIPDKVVARIAARAAREALTEEAAASPERGSLSTPSASVTTGNGTARLRLSMNLLYPTDLVTASRRVQQYVGERVTRLTGMKVIEVSVVIEQLVASGSSRQGRVR